METTNQIEERVLDFKHDIRNPLYIAKSLIETHIEYLEALSSSSTAVPSHRTKIILKKSIREIDRVLETIRRLNQMAIGCVAQSAVEQVCVKEILRRITSALRAGRYLDHLILVESIASDLPKLNANLVDLEEIFFNLIVNAAQATREGGQLTIRAFTHPKPTEAILISFQDTGCGISEEALPHIFEPFYTGRSEKGGVGFGLYIVKQLVERNGGKISVQSKKGQGTTFTLEFPQK